MIDILIMIVVGLIIGAVAKFLMPGMDPGGIIVTILLGIAGSVVGGYLGRATGLYEPGQPAGFIMSVLGALVLLFAYRMLRGERAYPSWPGLFTTGARTRALEVKRSEHAVSSDEKRGAGL